MTAKEIREKRKKIADRMQALASCLEAEGRTEPNFTEAEQAEWKQLDADYQGMTSRLAVAERVETVQGEQTAPIAANPQVGRDDYNGAAQTTTSAPPPEEYRALAIQAWFRMNASREFSLEARHVEACEALGFNPHSKELVIRLCDTPQIAGLQEAFQNGPKATALQRARMATRSPDFRAGSLSSIGVSSGGAIFAPETMVNQLEIATMAYGGILQACEILRTDGRERIRWPTAKDFNNKGRRLGQSGSVSNTTTAQPSFGEVYWDSYKYTSDEIMTPYELLTGTPIDLPSVLGKMMGIRIGRKFSDDATTGTGANQPKGIVTGAVAAGAVTPASQTALGWDDLQTLISAVDPSYRQGAAFMFHDAIRESLMNLKDGIGRPMWANGPNGEEPATLRGYPWFINQSMDSTIAHGKNTVLFGQLQEYKVRQVKEIRIYRLVERYREQDQDAFMAFQEMDGNLLDAGGGPVKVLQH